jgi:hypothetical protein
MGNEFRDRIIIPYYRLGGKWRQFEGRAMNDDAVAKYLSPRGMQKEPYRIDWLDVTKPFFMTEGAIDSMLIPNSISFGGAQLISQVLAEHPEILANKHNCCIIWDNDQAGIKEAMSTIGMGFKWFDWSRISTNAASKYDKRGNLRHIKDVNDVILYSDAFSVNSDGFILTDSVMPYVMEPDGGIRMALANGIQKRPGFQLKPGNATNDGSSNLMI